ncbi:MAG: YfcE family phosphodiesterase [Gemmataceae bacterium]
MKLGILSDTHDQLDAVNRALRMLRAEGVELLLHCGDIESPETVCLFAGWPVHFVYGNCDRDRPGLAHAMQAIGATNHQRYGHLECEGHLLGWVHGDDRTLLHDLIVSGAYDFVFHGHTHQAGEQKQGKTQVINPGAFTRVSQKTVLVMELPERKREWRVVVS